MVYTLLNDASHQYTDFKHHQYISNVQHFYVYLNMYADQGKFGQPTQ